MSSSYAASFQGLEGPIYGISADGSVAVGRAFNNTYFPTCRWDQGVITWLDDPSGTFEAMYRAHGVSADGRVIVGDGRTKSGDAGFRWEDGVVTALGDLPGGGSSTYVSGISDNGSVVVGHSSSSNGWSEAFRWTKAGGMKGLGDLSGGFFWSSAHAASADGSVIVGYGHSAAGGEAFRWGIGGMIGLGSLPGESNGSIAYGVTPDGAIVVGSSNSSLGWQAFLWTEQDGMVGLGDLPGAGKFSSVAFDVSADGSVVVGAGSTDLQSEAFIWDAAHGMRNLKEVLETDYGLDLTGWVLDEARVISDDGLTIGGQGFNPDGVYGGWIAHIPEPATLSLLILGALTVRIRKRTASKA